MAVHRKNQGLWVALAVVIVLLRFPAGVGQAGVINSAQAATLGDPAELEAFLDGAISAQMQATNTPGAVVVVVKDGRVLLAKGYGYADREQRIPVDPEKTLFRPGSVSKLFTWTAVMQLVEQGELDLDEDVNAYLDFAIPETYPRPVTLAHLMTHTPGFEDSGANLFKPDPGELLTLGDYVKTRIPARVFPPGEIPAYSNYGAALAGYIIERVSGLPYEEYIEENILLPLGMEHSTFRQPLPAGLAGDMAQGYNFSGGEYYRGGFEYIQGGPAGALSATGWDMAQFMLAHLQHGELDGQRILGEATAAQMHTRLFSPDPRLPGNAHGFFESVINGERVISHGGDTFLFHSGLYLLINQKAGIYLSTNGSQGGQVVEQVVSSFMDHYFAAEEQDAPPPNGDTARRYPEVAGSYLLTRSNFTTIEKLFNAIGTPASVNWNKAGYLVVTFYGRTYQLAETEEGLFSERYHPEFQAVLKTAPNGRPLLMFSEPFGLIKTEWYGSRGLHLALAGAATLLALWTTIAWPVQFLGALRRKEKRPAPDWLARLTGALFSGGWLAMLASAGVVFGSMDPHYGVPAVIFTDPADLTLLRVLPWLLFGLAGGMVIFTGLAWARKYWNVRGRVFYTLLTTVAVLVVGMLAYWNFV